MSDRQRVHIAHTSLRHDRYAKIGHDHAGNGLKVFKLHIILHSDIAILQPRFDHLPDNRIPVKPDKWIMGEQK